MVTVPSRAEVRRQVLTCTHCPLHLTCTSPVPFRGVEHPRLAIIGEAPGRWEDRARKPFVGPAGVKLGHLLRLAGWDVTSEVAFLNTVSCWPSRPDAKPTWVEVDACHANLMTQLAYLQPERIVTVGATAVGTWWPNLAVKDVRARWWDVEVGGVMVPALATYHPAAVLRDPALEPVLHDDLERAYLGPALTAFSERNYSCVVCGKDAEVWVSEGRDVTEKEGWGMPWCRKDLRAYRLRERKDGGGWVQLSLLDARA